MTCENSRERVFKDQRGSVLIAGLMLVFAVTLMGLGFYSLAVIQTRDVLATETDVLVKYAAESGLNAAAQDVALDTVGRGCPGGWNCGNFDALRAALNSDNSTPHDPPFYASTCFGSALCDSDHNPRSPANIVQAVKHADVDKLRLISTACVPGPVPAPGAAIATCPADSTAAAQVRALVTRVTPPGQPGFPGAAFAASTAAPGPSIDMRGDTDSYDSRKPGCSPIPCAYGGGNVGNEGDIVSNGNITVQGQIHGSILSHTDVAGDLTDVDISGNGTHVYGSVQCGGTCPGGGTPVDGGVTQNSPTAISPLPTEPNCGPPYTTLTAANATVTGGKTLAQVYNSSTGVLEFNSGTVTLQPGIYCFSTVHVSTNGASLNVTGTAVTGIFVDGQIYLQSGARINNQSQDPEKLQFISTYGNDAGETGFGQCGGAGVCLDAGGTIMYITMYAPTTKVVFQGGGTLFGAIAAKTIKETGTGNIHFDVFLKSGNANLLRGVPGTGAGVPAYSLASWQQCRRDPSDLSAWLCS